MMENILNTSLEKKIKVIGVDFDLNALDRAYINSKKNNINFFQFMQIFLIKHQFGLERN